MKESRLIELLRTLTKQELKQLRDFVKSPYHNKNKHVIALFGLIEKAAPDFDKKLPDKQKAFRKLFPGKPFDDLKMRHLISMLYKVVQDFLVVNQVFSDKVDVRIRTVNNMRHRGLERHFVSAMKQARKEQEDHKRRDLGFFYNQFLIEQEEELMAELMEGRPKSTNLQVISDNLDVFYIVNKLKQCCAIASYQNVFKQDYDINLVDEVLAYLDENPVDIPVVNLYHFGLLTLIRPEEEQWYFRLKDQLNNSRDVVAPNELKDLHVIARNHAIKRQNTGEQRFVRELFELYQMAIEAELTYNEQHQFSLAVFKNVVAVGLKLKEFQYVEEFIIKHSAQLDEEYRSDYLNFTLAQLSFEQEEYKIVRKLLAPLDFKEVFLLLSSRLLMMKTYYELGEFEYLESYLESFKQLISRRKVLGYHATNYKNILRFTSRLLNLKAYDQAKREQLRKQIEQTKTLTEKKWLLEKLDELS